MAWIPLYLLQPDVEFLNDWMNQDDEIAFLVSDSEKKWIAKKEHSILPDIGTQMFGYGLGFVNPNWAEYNLWHIPSGPLPLLGSVGGPVELQYKKDDEKEMVSNPLLGWTDPKKNINSIIPNIEVGHPGIFNLFIKLPDEHEIPMSHIGWIGNRYKIIGYGAEASTEKFWNKLRRMAKKVATQIPRRNNPKVQKEIYAFPNAYKEIQNGRLCASNP